MKKIITLLFVTMCITTAQTFAQNSQELTKQQQEELNAMYKKFINDFVMPYVNEEDERPCDGPALKKNEPCPRCGICDAATKVAEQKRKIHTMSNVFIPSIADCDKKISEMFDAIILLDAFRIDFLKFQIQEFQGIIDHAKKDKQQKIADAFERHNAKLSKRVIYLDIRKDLILEVKKEFIEDKD